MYPGLVNWHFIYEIKSNKVVKLKIIKHIIVINASFIKLIQFKYIILQILTHIYSIKVL